jgi:hypothetical protein
MWTVRPAKTQQPQPGPTKQLTLPSPPHTTPRRPPPEHHRENGTVNGCPGCTAPSIAFSSRIRSTTAEASDEGATRSANSHKFSPGNTRTTFVVDQPPDDGKARTTGHVDPTSEDPRRAGHPAAGRRPPRGSPSHDRLRARCRNGRLDLRLVCRHAHELPPDHSSNICSKVEQPFDRTFVRFCTTGHRQKTRPARRVVEQVFDLLVTYG